LKARSSETDRKVYRLLNRIFLAILLGVILYSLMFSPEKHHRPVPSGSVLFSDQATISTGLSRSFSAAVRFDFESALEYNPHGPRVFLFFIIQILMRVSVLVLVSRIPVSALPVIIWIDVLLSVFLFLVTFWPFLSNLIISFLNS